MKWGKIILVIFGAVVITAFGIDASDTLRGESSTMLAQLVGTEVPRCPPGMQSVDSVPTLGCVDMYEAAPSTKCPHTNPVNALDTLRNVQEAGCQADSREAVEPWRFVTRDQAMQLCARAGKRLPTNTEWYSLALSVTGEASACNVTGDAVAKTGAFTACVSSQQSYDLIGNVWEWVSDDVIEGVYQDTILPGSGYVAQVNAHGVATVVSEQPEELFGEDYFWSKNEGVFGIIRGGFYGSGSDAGLYAVHADTLPTSAVAGVGFRCVK